MRKYRIIVLIPGVATRFEKIIEAELADVDTIKETFVFYDSKGNYYAFYPKQLTIIEVIE